MSVLRIAAVLVRDDAGRVLLVRKRGTSMYMQPGGKVEPGESPATCGARELREELGLVLAEDDLTHLGSWSAPAANEAGFTVDAECYTAPLTGEPVAAAEIEEIRWLAPGEPLADDLAPLLVEHVLPAVDFPGAG